MKILALLAAGIALLVLSALLMNSNSIAAEPKSGQVLRHVVLFKFKPDATPAQIEEVVKAFRGLAKEISVIKGFEWGTNVSPENRSKGFTHCFLVTFASEGDRDDYLKHSAHQAFVAKITPAIDDVAVVDFWSEK